MRTSARIPAADAAIPCLSTHITDLGCQAIGKTTAICRLLEKSSVPLEEVSRLVAAYERTLRALDLVDRHDPVTEIVAKKVIEIGKRCGDAVEIAKLAVSELAIRKGHHRTANSRAIRNTRS